MAIMFLRCTTRKKNGRIHRSWSIVENKRGARDRIVQRHVLYLGEINDQQQAAWQKPVEIFEYGQTKPRTVALFPEDRIVEVEDQEIVRLKLSEWQLRRPPSRKGTRWDLVLQTLCAYRWIDPGSEWRLHRQWFEQSAMADLQGADFAQLAESHKLEDKLRQLPWHEAREGVEVKLLREEGEV